MNTQAQSDDTSVQRLFEQLAVDAAHEIISARRSGFTVESKADASPITDADTRAEAVIIAGLERVLPDVPHVGEEEAAGGNLPESLGDQFILIDPLDGTREFVSGRDEFTVNIALIRSGIPRIGVVLAPALGCGYSAKPGHAERLILDQGGNVQERRSISVAPPCEPLRIVASRSHRTAETDAFIADYPDAEIVSVGSSLKFCMLAEGKADLYPRFGRTMEWDTAAGDAVLRAAGGRTRLIDGGLLNYGKRDQINDCDFANPWFVAEAQSEN